MERIFKDILRLARNAGNSKQQIERQDQHHLTTLRRHKVSQLFKLSGVSR